MRLRDAQSSLLRDAQTQHQTAGVGATLEHTLEPRQFSLPPIFTFFHGCDQIWSSSQKKPDSFNKSLGPFRGDRAESFHNVKIEPQSRHSRAQLLHSYSFATHVGKKPGLSGQAGGRL